jgi:hypothetical protein
MEQLDKAIRKGLLRQAPGAIHPDADQLTGFLEQALAQPERQQVLLHLSQCSDCREVVALSLPELEMVPVAAAQPESSVWKRWLVVRWAAAAAAVLLVAGTVTLMRSGNQPQQTASIVDGPAYIASKQVKPADQAPQAEAPKTQTAASEPKTESKPEAKKQADAKSKAAEPAMMASTVRADHAPAAANEVAATSGPRADTVMAKAAPVAPPPSTLATTPATLKTPVQVVTLDRPVPVTGTLAGAGASGGAFPSGTGRSLRPSDEPVLETYNQPEGVFTLQPKNPQAAPGTRLGVREGLRRQAPVGVGMFSTSTSAMPNAPALNRRWMVSSDGQLKRSHAIGEEFHPVYVADGIFFKAVAESGSEVWAGGIGGALYHSTDDGKSWMKLMPSAGDQPLIADVTSIHATQRGAAELLTSNGEHWITIDGGQHWTRR